MSPVTDWGITINGVGSAECGDSERRVRDMVQGFVRGLRKQGYVVTSAKFSVTTREDLTKLDRLERTDGAEE